MKLYLVSGAHHDVPNLLSYLRVTAASADAAALQMVNMIRDDTPRDGMDSDTHTPALAALPAGSDWRAGLREAQRCIVSFERKIPLDCVTNDHDDLVQMSRANVELVEISVDDTPALPAAIEDLSDAGQRAFEALSELAELHSPEEAAALALRDALQMMRFAAIWQAGEAITVSPPCDPLFAGSFRGFQPADLARAQVFDVGHGTVLEGGGLMFGPGQEGPVRSKAVPFMADPDAPPVVLFPPSELTPVHVVVGCYGGMPQWAYADHGRVKLTTIDFDVEADDHSGFDLTLVVADDGTAAAASVCTEDVELNPDYIERLLDAAPCDGEGYVYGDDDEDQVEDPAKWLVSAEIGILGPDGGTTSYSGFFPDTDSMPQLLAMASATIRRRFEPAAVKIWKLTTVPPKPAKGEGE